MSKKVCKMKQGLLLLGCLVAAVVSKLHPHKWKQDMK